MAKCNEQHELGRLHHRIQNHGFNTSVWQIPSGDSHLKPLNMADRRHTSLGQCSKFWFFGIRDCPSSYQSSYFHSSFNEGSAQVSTLQIAENRLLGRSDSSIELWLHRNEEKVIGAFLPLGQVGSIAELRLVQLCVLKQLEQLGSWLPPSIMFLEVGNTNCDGL